jgi:ferric-dicitrate binding protein FerR (iron transport regulator)
VALIVIAGSLFAYFMLQKHDKTPALMATATTSAQTDSVLLAEGSTVWLTRNSSLHYPGAFAGKTRKVKLRVKPFLK